MTTRILLIDDHALVRSGIGMVVSAGLTDVEIIEADSLASALLCTEASIDLVLLDIQLEALNGLEGIALLKQKWPGSKIVVISAIQGTLVIQEAIARGAQGFVHKSEKPARILEVINQVLTTDPKSQQMMVQESTVPTSRKPTLTPRQFQVLDLLCHGLSNKMIGRQLNLSEHTVRGHVQATLQVLQVSSRSEAAFTARHLGLIV
ncbi:MAG: response regulator [Pseudomonas sp.]|uniref:response regulator n=1 Tax=Pseudomonas sp. TaxID=306 RepID=UPI003D10DE6C